MRQLVKAMNIPGGLYTAIRYFIAKNQGRTVRQKVFAMLHPTATSGPLHRYIDNFVVFAVLLSVVSIVLETVPLIHGLWHAQFHVLEQITVVLFSLEYLGRVYSCCENPNYTHPIRGRLKYMRSIGALIDLVAILPFYLGLFLFNTFDLRFMRVFRLSRLLKLTRYTGTLNTLFKAVHRERRVLFASAFMMVLLVVLTASLGYELEHTAQPDKFESIPDSMYWAVITLASVGYGDISPITPWGRAMTAVISLLGIGIFAIPAGLMASAFTDQLRIDRETFESEFREALAKGLFSSHDRQALNAEAERLHLTPEDVQRITAKVEHEMKSSGQTHLDNFNGIELMAHFRQQISQLRLTANARSASDLDALAQNPDDITATEKMIWEWLRKHSTGK